jgi:Escherichia/Staphylococcus phage prohead protease
LSNTLERRIITGCEIRATKDSRTITGYAAIYNSDSQDLGGFIESIKPGAFTRSLQDNPQITALVDHEFQQILGRTDESTLRLAEDDKGLRFEIDLPNTRYADDLLANILHRNIKGMSFGFKPSETVDRWYNADGVVRRDLLDIALVEITATSIPAYDDTAVSISTRDKAAELAVDTLDADEIDIANAEMTEEGEQAEDIKDTMGELAHYQNDLLKVEIDLI